MTEAATQMWNGVADRWARHAESVDAQSARATRAMLDAAHVGPGSTVLDLGCGPGGAGLAAARRTGPTGQVVFADVAPAMLEIAARRSVGLPGVSTMVADLTSIPMTDGHADAVICRYALMFTDDPTAAVREAGRVLRPGGRYAALTIGAPGENRWHASVLDALADVLATEFPPSGTQGPFALADAGVLAGALEDGGLVDVRIEELPSTLVSPSWDAWWEESSQLAGPVPLILAELDPATREAVKRRAQARAEDAALVDKDGVHFHGLDLLAVGRRPDPGLATHPAASGAGPVAWSRRWLRASAPVHLRC